MALMSYRMYAAHRGCSLRAVQKAIGEVDAAGQRVGRIAAALVAVEGNPHPKIDAAKADVLWALNTDAAKRSTLFTPPDDLYDAPDDFAAALPRGAAPAPVAGGVDAGLGLLDLPGVDDEAADEAAAAARLLDSASEEVKRSYHQARALREKINSENAQLDLDLRKGNLVSLDDAKRLGFTALRQLRDALRNVGPRIAAEVAALTDPFDCELMINAEIDAVLGGITADKLLAEVDDDDDDTPDDKVPS